MPTINCGSVSQLPDSNHTRHATNASHSPALRCHRGMISVDSIFERKRATWNLHETAQICQIRYHSIGIDPNPHHFLEIQLISTNQLVRQLMIFINYTNHTYIMVYHILPIAHILVFQGGCLWGDGSSWAAPLWAGRHGGDKKSLSLLWIAVPLEHAGFKILCSVDLEMGFRWFQATFRIFKIFPVHFTNSSE